ncbi:uncharacterized protein BO88DRAFT_175554 [Aspergillus vadensis CBS 113365]|uniref:Uncharacterized protein n=1 Tax=Aspergillus vadensis (strain CBS 113365 / IMI 142717 / IBT 24658) TaxID=1448311 RepID=A0A319CCK4_ASPVC|nr:hypothetical protein BO88DRAFT_175554 [Aspergillus vadensis CBS 113365]PYH73028.1 hypothetical protein BO88DRAFT_175554 [Aspergillus vadensis CBS 113365]
MGLRLGLRFSLFMWVWIRLVDWWRMVEELFFVFTGAVVLFIFLGLFLYFCFTLVAIGNIGIRIQWGAITEFMSLATKQVQQFKYTGFSLAPVNTHPMHGKRVANRPNS